MKNNYALYEISKKKFDERNKSMSLVPSHSVMDRISKNQISTANYF